MAKGMRINRPKTSLQRNLQKLGRVNKQRRRKQKGKSSKDKEVKDPLITTDILKKQRTNPKANITLSGKKRRLLIKKNKKNIANAMKMEAETTTTNMTEKVKKKQTTGKAQSMDIDE